MTRHTVVINLEMELVCSEVEDTSFLVKVDCSHPEMRTPLLHVRLSIAVFERGASELRKEKDFACLPPPLHNSGLSGVTSLLVTGKPCVMPDFFSTFALHIIPSIFSSDGEFQFGTLINLLI